MKKEMITFRASEETCNTIAEIMDYWNTDRTTVMTLALYSLHIHLSERRHQTLHEIIDSLHSRAPKDLADFGRFSWGAPRVKRR